LVVAAILLRGAGSCLAQEPALDDTNPTATILDAAGVTAGSADSAVRNQIAINMIWVLLAAFLVMFMQAGFAMVETGLVRSRNVSHTTAMNLMIYSIAVLGFFLCGFAVMFGGSGGSSGKEAAISLFGKNFGLLGHHGLLLSGRANDLGILAAFLFQAAIASTAATIATGALAERWKFLSFVIYGAVMTMLIYPVFGNWVWGGGWLSQLGANFGLGHGHVDFAGSSVVHMTGGVAAAVGCWMLGPRIGKYSRNGSVNVMIAHNAPMYMLGTLILAFGWFGFTGGHCVAGDLNIGRVATNTALASAAGAVASMLYLWRLYKKPDPSFICNGMLAGLVAISAPCAFVTPTAAAFIGLVAGILVVGSVLFVERVVKLDDPVGAISVHGVNGAWGVLALGLFADGTYGQGWNNSHWYRVPGGALKWVAEKPNVLSDGWTEQGVTGLFYGNGSQFVAECVGLVANLVWMAIASYLLFRLLDRLIGNRVSMTTELQGLDIPELGVLGYVTDDPKPMARSQPVVAEPRPAAAPKVGASQFSIVLEGIDVPALQAAWSALCQPAEEPPEPDFLAIYPQFTTLKGNQFRFREGSPEEMRMRLERLLKTRFPERMILARVGKD
jgi:Amt family ammonium transporter